MSWSGPLSRTSRRPLHTFFFNSLNGAICACQRPLEAIQTVPKALSEPSVTLDHRTDPPDPLGAVSGRSELPNGRYARMAQIEQVNIVPCFRLTRRPGGCAASHREHTTSGDIAVAGASRKSRRQRRALGGCFGRYVTCRCGSGRVPRTAEVAPNRSVRMDCSQNFADTTCLKAQDPLWVHPGRSRWCSLDSWSASLTVSFTRGPLLVAYRRCEGRVERRQISKESISRSLM